MEQLSCPSCTNGFLREEMKEHEFPFTERNPVLLKARYPVFVCHLCGRQSWDHRGEKARALAVAEYMKSQQIGLDAIPEPYYSLHALNFQHRQQLAHVGRAGCFYCLQFFDAVEVTEWIDAGQTALCPRCRIDAVLPATEEVTAETLQEMKKHWFAPATLLPQEKETRCGGKSR